MDDKTITIIDVYFEEYDHLLLTAISIVRKREFALDILQDVALNLIEKQDQLVILSNPRAFLHKCVRNAAIDAVRKYKQTSSVCCGYLEEVAKRTDTGHDIELNLWLKSHLKEYPPQLQTAFCMHFLYGYSVKELAHVFHMKPNTLTQKFKRIKANLAQSQS